MLITLFSFSIFFSALLLFIVQPMVGKMILPHFGASPSVWTTCMMFFQFFLLLGYCYTHWTFRKFGVSLQKYIHIILMGVALLFLPISIQQETFFESEPAFEILFILTVRLAIPFLILAASAPLIQKWFSCTDHSSSDKPFFLYAASNLGSMFALILYPIVIEPRIGLTQQSVYWQYAYVLLLILISICAYFVKDKSIPQQAETTLNPTSKPPSANTIFYWIAASFIPSSLLLSTTHYITTDLTPMPLLWVFPLLIYLLTFVIAFSERIKLPEDKLKSIAYAFLMIMLTVYSRRFNLRLITAIHLLNFGFIAMVCHSYLAKTKPDSSHLTDFYLWLSFGGFLGGMFNGIIAPNIFIDYTEYSLALIIACFFISRFDVNIFKTEQFWDKYKLIFKLICDNAFIALVAIFSINVIFTNANFAWLEELMLVFGVCFQEGFLKALLDFLTENRSYASIFMASTFLIYLLQKFKKSIKFNLALFVAFMIVFGDFSQSIQMLPRSVIYQTRSFFGVMSVVNINKTRLLQHGTTKHGAQIYHGDEEDRRTPISYYGKGGPVGDLFRLPLAQKEDLKVGAVGLGVGVVAAYAQEGHKFDFYEIDAEVLSVAENESYFTYLADCKGDYSVILGDGRIQIAQANDNYYDIIMLDAFSSVSVPMHLLTLEAIELYLKKLAPGGIIAFHASNRELFLDALLIIQAQALDLDIRIINDLTISRSRALSGEGPSIYVMMSPDSSVFPSEECDDFRDDWTKIPTSKILGQPLTDEISSIIPFVRGFERFF